MRILNEMELNLVEGGCDEPVVPDEPDTPTPPDCEPPPVCEPTPVCPPKHKHHHHHFRSCFRFLIPKWC